MKANTGRIILLLFFVAGAFTCANAQTQLEMNEEACGEYKKADAELNRTYRQILKEYKADLLFIRKLQAAQRAWVAYRDAHLDALYTSPDPQSEYGSVYPMCRCLLLTELTTARTKTLQRWTEGVEEGDVCAGSIRVRQ